MSKAKQDWVHEWVIHAMEADRDTGHNPGYGPRYAAWYAYLTATREALGLAPLSAAIESCTEVSLLMGEGVEFDAIKAAMLLIYTPT